MPKQSNGPATPVRPNSASPKARLLAFYLPQFHPVPENDQWWGKGFTEWTNTAKAKPMFPGHYQPHVPADLGFYDLRLPEVRAAQAVMARSAGVEGFCYWHYWFAGRRILERPFQEVLRSGEPDLPFCLAWANQSWTGVWHGAPRRMLIEQTYPGPEDHEKHFYTVLEAFHDPRYLRVRGKPVFVIFHPVALPKPAEFIEQWQRLAEKNGLPGIHFIAHVAFRDQPYDYLPLGYAGGISIDVLGVCDSNAWQRALKWYQGRNKTALVKPRAMVRAAYLKAKKSLDKYLGRPSIYDHSEAMLYFLDHATPEPHNYPCVLPNWDNSPRSGKRGVVFHNSTPELFRRHLRDALQLVTERPFEDRLVFVKSWNEWAEGNYVEPDLKFGHQYLDVLREEVLSAQVQKAASPTAKAHA